MNCIWCGSKLPSGTSCTVTDHLRPGRERLPFYRCGECGSDTLGTPSVNTGAEFYEQDYMFRYEIKETLLKNILQRVEWCSFYRPAFAADVARLKKISGTAGKRLLDVGFGSGLRLKLMRDAGFAAEGIECSSECVRYAREKLGCPVKKAELEDIVKTGDKFDIVTAYAVLEHVRSPRKFLQNMAELLNDGGFALVRVPVNDSCQLKTFGGTHSLYREAPRHVWIPSTKALSVNIEGLGLELIYRKSEPIIWAAGQVGCTMMPASTYSRSRRNTVLNALNRFLGGAFTVVPGLAFAAADALSNKGAQTDFLYRKTGRPHDQKEAVWPKR